jgi:Ca2+-binding RTX toxin-like protein
VDYSASSAGVTIEFAMLGDVSVGVGTGGDAENDYLESVENLIGSAHADTFIASDDTNVLSGNGGDDTLDGGKGRDSLDGGTGADTFAWRSEKDSKAGNKRDVVADFSEADGDLIDLSAIDAKEGGSDNPFHFTANDGTGAFSNDRGELRFFDDGTHTYIQGDVDGDGNADFEIALVGVIALTAADFVM